MKRVAVVLALFPLLAVAPLAAQQAVQPDDSAPSLRHQDLDGPRFGLLVATGPKAEQRLAEHGLKNTMSVIGWHFEQIVSTQARGPQLVTQQVLLVAGLDQSTAIPSGTLLFGVRFPGAIEFGVGPNVSPLGVALTMGVGTSIRAGQGVTIPISVAIVQSQGAMRTSFLVGYAIRRH